MPADVQLSIRVDDEEKPLCCVGCQAVAHAIIDGGLENFYRYREITQITNATDSAGIISTPFYKNNKASTQDWSIYNMPDIQQSFVLSRSDGNLQANLLLEGITCAACSWLIETHFQKYPAVKQVNVNVSTHRVTLIWNPELSALSDLMASLASIGYMPRPATDEQQQDYFKRENRIALFRLGVAGFGMMQAMMVAVGIYFGATDEWLNFLRWLSMLCATPVVFFSAWPFFSAAWTSIRSRHLVMDVPVALAIGLAYAASAWATVTESGEVYFESVSMFAFFLLLGRYIEQKARHNNRLAFGNLAQLMPLTACCIRSQDGEEITSQIPLNKLCNNDLVLVKPGDTFPCDGIVVDGESDVIEALITGESIPVAKRVGDRVIAGTLNGQSSLRVRATAIGGATQLSAIEHLAAQAAEEKPQQVEMADKIARFFVARLLVVCVCVFAFWWFKDSSRALWITLSVLVVTCPCALALAMPAALSAATANLRQRGFLVARGHVIETLNKVNRVIFDKTGTLTQGRLSVVDVNLAAHENREQVLAIAAALEADFNHPIAQAFSSYKKNLAAERCQQFLAAGVEGQVNGVVYRLGTPEFIAEFLSLNEKPAFPDQTHLWLLLSSESQLIAWIALEDSLRFDAAQTVQELKAQGINVELLSGDQSGAVARLAANLSIDEFTAGAKPDTKLAQLHIAQTRGDVVLMVGDGINDVPVLAGADVSTVMVSASDLAQTQADTILLNNQLHLLPLAIRVAKKTRTIIRQNLTFSLTYNLIALPLAATGHVTPWAAALGMTMSSLVVVFNALRLNKVK